MKYDYAIQYTEHCPTAKEAIRTAHFLRTQEGYLGGRIIAPGKDTGFTVQCFFADVGESGEPWLPDGCRRVLLPESLRSRIA